MTGDQKPRGLPLDDVERLARWEALVAARNAEIARLREAAAETILALRYSHADPAEIAQELYEATQLAGHAGAPEPVVQAAHEQARQDAARRVASGRKRCPKCSVVKSLKAFAADSSALDGRDRYCAVWRKRRPEP